MMPVLKHPKNKRKIVLQQFIELKMDLQTNIITDLNKNVF